MWIKAEDGSIYKINQIRGARVMITGSALASGGCHRCYGVVADYTGRKPVHLTEGNKTEAEARAIVNRIFHHKSGNLDLSSNAMSNHNDKAVAG